MAHSTQIPAGRTAAKSLADLLLERLGAPRTAMSRVVLALAGSALLALSAQVVIPLGLVPGTMQTFAVVLIGATLGARLGALTVLLYLLEGSMGLPVFAGGGAGVARMAGPTGGYLLAFVPAAWLVGRLSERGWTRLFWPTVGAMLLGEGLILAAGAAWVAVLTGSLTTGLVAGAAVFLPGAVVKALLAAATLPYAWRLVGRR